MFQLISFIILTAILIEVLSKVSKKINIKRKGNLDYNETKFLRGQLEHLKNKRYE